MLTFYDTGWITGSAGNIVVASRMGDVMGARVILAASGAVGSPSASVGWTAGAETPVPWMSPGAPNPGGFTQNDPPCLPLVTSSYLGVVIPAPTTGSHTELYWGMFSGTLLSGTLVHQYVPAILNITLTKNTGSYWGRVIIEGF